MEEHLNPAPEVSGVEVSAPEVSVSGAEMSGPEVSAPEVSELPPEILADLAGLVADIGQHSRQRTRPLRLEERGKSSAHESGLPAEVLADLAGLVTEMERDRLPGFDHDPPAQPASNEPERSAPASFSSLVGPPISEVSEAHVTEESPRTQTVSRQLPARSNTLAPQWVPQDPAATLANDGQRQAGSRSAWLSENWPFLLAGVFVILGVVLVILVLTSAPAVAPV